MERNKDPFDDVDTGGDSLELLSDDLLVSEPMSGDLSWDGDSEQIGTEVEVSEEEEPQSSRLLTEADHGVLKQEAERQEIRDYQSTVAERDRAIEKLEEAQQFLEDELEDANTEIDRLGRELDKSTVEVEEADFQRREAEGARKQVESSLYEVREGTERTGITDLRDNRVHKTTRPLGIHLVTLWPMLKGLMVGALLGAILVIGLFELSLYLSDKEELFQLVFGNH